MSLQLVTCTLYAGWILEQSETVYSILLYEMSRIYGLMLDQV